MLKTFRNAIFAVATSLVAATVFAQDVELEIAVKVGDRTEHAAKVTIPLDKQAEVAAGQKYQLAIVASRASAQEIQLAVVIREVGSNANPVAVTTQTYLGYPTKLLNGALGASDIEITPRLR